MLRPTSVLTRSLATAVVLSLAPAALTQSTSARHAAGDGPLLTSVPQQSPPVALVSRLPGCKAENLLVSTDGEGGNFSGMSHAGTLIIVRNNGTEVCKILPLAQASLMSKDGKQLGPFTATPPHVVGMHPGPVVLPVALAVNAELTATLYWVSNAVFADNLCLEPATLVLTFGSLSLRTPLAGRLCGERAKGVSAELSRFAPDSVVQAAPPPH